jgi:signal transduction histidine kinase
MKPAIPMKTRQTIVKFLLKKRLQLQLLFIMLATVLVAALSVFLISDAVRSAEGVVLADAARTLTAAVSELNEQSPNHTDTDSAFPALPVAARDASLRRVSQVVLRLFPGVEGGYYDGAHFLGYSFPTHDAGLRKTDVPTAELDDILAAIEQSRSAGTAQRILRGRHDIVVIEAKTDLRRGLVGWTMKRLTGGSDAGGHRREILLSALVLAALVCIAGTLATGLLLQRGIDQIKSGLAALESDFSYRLPQRKDELGEVSDSINRMADARQKLETDLRREDRMRAVGRLVARMAHEIRNPLNSIRLAVEYVERRLGKNDVRAADLHSVLEEVDRLSSLLSNLLTFQKTRRPDLRDQPVAPVLEKCVSLIQPQADARNVKIRARTGVAGLQTRFDREHLTQMLMNLLLNAIEAAGQGGSIDVRLEQDEEVARIQVQDSGPGLTAEQKEHLFEAFYSTKAGGTGLGLAVSRELAEGMGASLRYRSDGPGATFEIELRRIAYANSNNPNC